MHTVNNRNSAGRARYAARPRRRTSSRVSVPAALLCAALLISLFGIGWKVWERISERRALADLRKSVSTAQNNVVVIRLKETPMPKIPLSPSPALSPSPDPKMQSMLARTDNLRVLQEKNADLLGWIVIPDTKVDYPVMYTPDRKWHYLNRDFDGKESASGLPFADESCKPAENSCNLLVYGHRMKDGSMYAGLHKFKDADYYAEHRTLYFITPQTAARYEIVAVAPVEVTEDTPCPFYLYTCIENAAAFDEYVHIIKEASLYPDDMTAVYGDELITLCTCGKHDTPERLLVVAKRTA